MSDSIDKQQEQINDNHDGDYTEYENVIDFQEVQLNRLIARLCERYHVRDNTIIGLVMKNVEIGVLCVHEIEENINDFMQIKAAQQSPK